MQPLLEKAKNSELTIQFENFFYHSKYNPSAEAQKWIESIECDFTPYAIVVIGCGIPYSINFLKQKFSTSKLFTIQFDSIFKQFDNSDFTSIYFDNNNANHLSEIFYDYFGEELCSRILWLEWKPCINIFNKQINIVNLAIQQYLTKARDVIKTRMFFSKKWIKNTLRFFSMINKICNFTKGNCPIILAASGSTLSDSYSFLKLNKEKFFLIAVSSAVYPLLENNITPDLIVTTDGGYWAKKHIDLSIIIEKNIPIACSSESGIPFQLLNNCIFAPFIYSDLANSIFFDITKIKGIFSNRNGTVSGNALELALQLTDNNIYTIGLDLQKNNGYTNAQPNKIEQIFSTQDNRISPLENRIQQSNLNQTSLQIYKSWFDCLPKNITKRIFRVCDKNNLLEDLGLIKTITYNEIKLQNFLQKPCKTIYTTNNENNLKIIKRYFKDILISLEKINDFTNVEIIEWIKTFCLGKFITYTKYPNRELFLDIINDTKKEINSLLLLLSKH